MSTGSIAPGREQTVSRTRPRCRTFPLSHLALVRRLPTDWTECYGTTPVLIETFVEAARYTGAVYRAWGWTLVGTT